MGDEGSPSSMNCTTNEVPKMGDTILIRNLDGSLELSKFPFMSRRPYTQRDFRNWWSNYNEKVYFCEWIKVDHAESF